MASSIASSLETLRLSGNTTPDSTTPPDSSVDLDPAARSAELRSTIDSLIARCTSLCSEIEIYVSAVEEAQKASRVHIRVEYKNLRNDCKHELAFLRKLLDYNMPEKKKNNYIASSNLIYYESLWNVAKQTSGLVSFRKYFFWNRIKEGHGPKGMSLAKGAQTKGKSAALVDIVAHEGREWIRVSSISEKRLIFDLAKLGWQNDSDDSDEDADGDASMRDGTNWEDEDDEDQVDIVKQARELARAARANPSHGRPPSVHMFFTRLDHNRMKEVDATLAKIRATGTIVHCASDIPPSAPIESVLPNLLIDRRRNLSETLNIDCTILLALISDISHRECEILDWYPGEVKAQIRDEEKEKLLPTHLYPAIGDHPMLCTSEAASQMNLIVNTLATDPERARADILLAQNAHASASPAELLSAWSDLSDHKVPDGFKLPIRVVESDPAKFARLPKVAQVLAKDLSPLNRAIFLYGWAEGITTLSSNGARARQIDSAITEHGLDDGEPEPHIWLCGESRSLIAKQGRRKCT